MSLRLSFFAEKNLPYLNYHKIQVQTDSEEGARLSRLGSDPSLRLNSPPDSNEDDEEG